jgi:hypothetical protein
MEIDTVSDQLTTLDFTSGDFTGRSFSRAKVIDMFGFQTGSNGLGLARDRSKVLGRPEEMPEDV